MSETDAMTINERRKYIYKIWGKYRKATKAEKGNMLDEMVYVTGMNRNYITQLLNGRLSRKQRVRQRGPSYGSEVLEVVRGDCQSIGLSLCGEAQTDADLYGRTFDAPGSVVDQQGNPREIGEDQYFYFEADASQDQKAN